MSPASKDGNNVNFNRSGSYEEPQIERNRIELNTTEALKVVRPG